MTKKRKYGSYITHGLAAENFARKFYFKASWAIFRLLSSQKEPKLPQTLITSWVLCQLCCSAMPTYSSWKLEIHISRRQSVQLTLQVSMPCYLLLFAFPFHFFFYLSSPYARHLLGFKWWNIKVFMKAPRIRNYFDGSKGGYC